jgi:zinc transport system permease protein
MTEFLSLFSYTFMIRALIAGSIIALIAPLIGSFLVIRRYSLIADTLSHLALTGVALGVLLHIEPILTTLSVTILAAIFIERLRSKERLPAEALLAMFLPGGLALSMILFALSQGIGANLLSFLFGSITTVTVSEIWLFLGLGLTTFLIILKYHRQLLYASFDEDTARVSGIPVNRLNLLILILTAVTVTLSMRIVGILLIGALMIIPVLTAMLLARSFTQTLIISVFFALLSVFSGLLTSYFLNFPSGATIVLTSLTLFTLASIIHRFT